MTSNPQLQKGIYLHYKGNKYEVLDVARHSETEEWMVVYRTLYKFGPDESSLWVRPLAMFLEHVTVDGATLPRFRLIEPK